MSAFPRELERKATLYNSLGLAFLLAGRSVRLISARQQPPNTPLIVFGAGIALGCFFLWIKGISALARSKGYSKNYGAFGFISFVGWTIVKLLPDPEQSKRPTRPLRAITLVLTFSR